MSANDEPVIARLIFYSFLIFCCYLNKFLKNEKLVKYLPYCTWHHMITSTTKEKTVTSPKIILTGYLNNITSNQMVNFPSWIPDCDSHSPALLDFFISSDASIFSKKAFPPLGNSDHVVVLVSIDFPMNSNQDAIFHHKV